MGRVRKANGTFKRGAAHRQYISEVQRKRYQRQREENPHPVEGEKHCTECGDLKHYDMEIPELSQFTPLTRTLVDGSKVKYPAGKCKKCQAEEATRRRAEMPVEERRRRRRQYMKTYRKKNRVKIRNYTREYSRKRRREAGVPLRGNYKKTKLTEEMVPSGPFVEWLMGIIPLWEGGIFGIAQHCEIDPERLRRIVKGERKSKHGTAAVEQVAVDLVDRVVLAIGGGTHLSDLYPELYE